jgi:alkanesulfonate monooxygenase SsuD/methylene tetrahydromethanopterin reductase-like flavin-dependent oxidoreductase (luciferase family)
LGHPADAEFSQFGEDPDPKVRAAKLDEGLDVLVGLWSGKPFSYQGRYYKVAKTMFLPPPVQSPRIPIWVGGIWPHKAPFRRAARWDGAFPLKTGGSMQARDLREIRSFIDHHRETDAAFDMVMMGYAPGDKPEKAVKHVAKYSRAGLTWWLESLFRLKHSAEAMRVRIQQGPPRAD